MSYFKLSIEPVKDEEILVALAQDCKLTKDLILANNAIYSNRKMILNELLDKLVAEETLTVPKEGTMRKLDEFLDPAYYVGFEDIEEILKHVPKEKIESYFGNPENVTGYAVRERDGDYEEIWLTTSSRGVFYLRFHAASCSKTNKGGRA
ncbi:MAG TPA: hypothetical protein P5539_12330 [Mesotoga sp.]|nr:hypothetical protein [Mesotoga sp.]